MQSVCEYAKTPNLYNLQIYFGLFHFLFNNYSISLFNIKILYDVYVFIITRYPDSIDIKKKKKISSNQVLIMKLISYHASQSTLWG